MLKRILIATIAALSCTTLEPKGSQDAVVLPMDPAERARALEGLRLIKQAERRQ